MLIPLYNTSVGLSYAHTFVVTPCNYNHAIAAGSNTIIRLGGGTRLENFNDEWKGRNFDQTFQRINSLCRFMFG